MIKILIIDDEQIIRERLKKLLELSDYETSIAENGEVGISKFIEEKPHIVILDIKMPGMNGIDVLKTIKEIDARPEIIMITGHGGVETAIEAMKEKAFCYIQKPIDFDELEIEITKILEKQDMQRKLDEYVKDLEITKRSLVKSEQQLKSVVETVSDGIISTDYDAKIIFINSSACKIIDYAHEDIIGKQLDTILPERCNEDLMAIFNDATTKKNLKVNGIQLELFGLKKDKSEFPMEFSILSWHIKEKIFFTCSLRDLTESKKAKKAIELQKQQLMQADKMSSLGIMAAGVAHEINNPLCIAKGDIHLLKRDVDDVISAVNSLINLNSKDSTLKDEVEKIKENADISYVSSHLTDKISRCSKSLERIESIVNNLKDFSHLDKQDLQEFDINKALKTTLELIPKKYKQGIQIKKAFKEIPLIECYGRQLNQVFFNISINALQAMENEGVLTLETDSNDTYIVLKFIDNGPGIDQKSINKIFDPFYTTKPIGEGTGLGLSISYSIVEEHGGSISVENNSEHGVTFTITLLKCGVTEYKKYLKAVVK